MAKAKDVKLFAECPECDMQVELHSYDFWASTDEGSMFHPSSGEITADFECPGCHRSVKTIVREW